MTDRQTEDNGDKMDKGEGRRMKYEWRVCNVEIEARDVRGEKTTTAR